jgi:hypothetical protein
MSQSSLNTAIVQKVITDANNTSSTNLSVTNSYTFTGTASSTMNVAGIQVMLFADQNCTIKVEQSGDSVPNWDISDSYQYYANGSFGITVQAVGSLFRVVVTTDGSTTTTAFRLSAILTPIIEALPRSLDDEGNLKVAIQSSKDAYGWEVENTPTGEMRIAEVVRLVGSSFDLAGNGGAPDPNFWTTTVANNGTVVQANSNVTIDTTTSSANGSAVFTSNRRARYVTASANRYRSVLMLNNNGAVNNVRRWGVAYGSAFPGTPTVTDGTWFQLSGTQFSICTQYANGVVNNVTSFNGELGTVFKPDLTTNHIYEIYWNSYGLWFSVDDETLHSITDGTTRPIGTESLYIYHSTVNSNSAQTSNSITLRTAGVHRLGKEATAPQRGLVSTANTYNFKYGPGLLQRIVIGNAGGTLMTIYDDTTGTANTLLTIPAFNNAAQGATSVDCSIPFSNGLKVVSTGTWSAAFVYE